MVNHDTYHVNFIHDFVRFKGWRTMFIVLFTNSTYINLNIKKIRSTISRRSFCGGNTIAGFVTQIRFEIL